MQRVFIESLIFTSLIEAENDKNLLSQVQRAVLIDLQLPLTSRDLIKGTGGFTKVRVADEKSGKGKSGGYRVITSISRLMRGLSSFSFIRSR